MDAAPSSNPAPGATLPPPPPAPPPAWPRCAQLATAFLLGLAVALLAGQALSLTRWGTRPTELRPQRIDLNRADRTELLQLPGVGAGLAERIENYRREHGPFRSVQELARVEGIGPRTLERLEGWVCVRWVGEAEVASDDVPRPQPTKVEKPDPAGSTKQTGAAKTAGLKELVNLNRATAEELMRLPGIGPKLSQRIIEERQKGPFKSVEDLRRVSGIGAKILENLKPYVTVEREAVRLVTAE